MNKYLRLICYIFFLVFVSFFFDFKLFRLFFKLCLEFFLIIRNIYVGFVFDICNICYLSINYLNF